MEEYHKINSVFMRDPATKHKSFLMGQYAQPEFEYLKDAQWQYTEKVDGTNVRVYWERKSGIAFGGRTKDAQMPTFLYHALNQTIGSRSFESIFPDCEQVTLYGEGYGAKIQKGGGDYLPNGCGFILFDVRIGDMWLLRKDVEDIASKFGIKVVPIIGIGTLTDAVALVQRGFDSQLRSTPPEGLVLRPMVELRTRRGDRVITKLKLKDFSN